jgi:hypothetical protein
MPRYQEEERIYHKGFRDGYRAGHQDATDYGRGDPPSFERYRGPADMPQRPRASNLAGAYRARMASKPKRKPSAWNKFVKVNSKKKQFRYANGKVNLHKLGVAYRKTKRGKR